MAVQTFLEAMRRLEDEITPESSARDKEKSDVCRIMVKTAPGMCSMPSGPRIDRVVGPYICSLLCSYRLLDVLYDQANPAASSHNPRYPKCSLKGLRPSSSVRYISSSVVLM